MTQTDSPNADVRPYASQQVAMHWLIVLLVAFQYFTGGGMEATLEARIAGTAPATGTGIVHGVIGTSILIAMLYRLSLRRRFGAPPPPQSEPGWLQYVSRGNHYLFYVFLIGMPLAGLVAILTLSEAVAEIHAFASTILLILIAAHVLGAVWHIFKRDGVVSRMVRRPVRS